MAILFHQRLVSPPTVAMEKRFDDRFRGEAECTKAGRLKEKIYGYREDELEERKREKRMEGRKWVWCERSVIPVLVAVFSRASSGRR